jgi:hypothetical protein
MNKTMLIIFFGIAVIVLAGHLASAPEAKCYDDEAFFSGSFWRGLFGAEPRLSDVFDPCFRRGHSETFNSPAQPRPATQACAAGSHIEGSECIKDGFHSVGNGRACRDGTHAEGSDKCIKDGNHMINDTETCPDGAHGIGNHKCQNDAAT